MTSDTGLCTLPRKSTTKFNSIYTAKTKSLFSLLSIVLYENMSLKNNFIYKKESKILRVYAMKMKREAGGGTAPLILNLGTCCFTPNETEYDVLGPPPPPSLELTPLQD
jgi:hypothetical protein